MSVTRRRLSVEERRRTGLIAQGRARSLSGITDIGVRRAIDALTSTENWDLEVLGFTPEGRLTVPAASVRDAVAPTGALSFKDGKLTLTLELSLKVPSKANMVEPAIRIEGSTLHYTQLPARANLATSATLANVITRINEMLEDQRRAGHRAR